MALEREELEQLKAILAGGLEQGFRRVQAVMEGAAADDDFTIRAELGEGAADASSMRDAVRQVAELQESINAQIMQRARINQQNLQAAKAERDTHRDGLRIAIQKLKVDEREKNLTDEQRQSLRDMVESLTKALTIAEKRYSVELAIVNAQKQSEQQADSLMKRFLGLSDYSERFVGNLMRAAQGGKGFDAIGKSLGSFANIIKSRLSVVNSFGSVLDKVVQSTYAMVRAYSDAMASFQRTTGMLSVYRDQIYRLWSVNSQLAVSFQEINNSLSMLHNNFKSFGMLARSTRIELADYNIILSRIGISMQDLVRAEDLMVNVLGKTAYQVKTSLNDMLGLARALNLPPGKLVQDFNTAMPILIRYGQSEERLFQGLVRQAQSLRVGIQDLISVAANYDTFDEAARRVGRLNAILGGPYLNSVRMLNATEEERVELIIRSVQASGLQFNELNKHYQQAIMTAAGIKDLNIAQRIFNGGLREYAAYRAHASMKEE